MWLCRQAQYGISPKSMATMKFPQIWIRIWFWTLPQDQMSLGLILDSKSCLSLNLIDDSSILHCDEAFFTSYANQEEQQNPTKQYREDPSSVISWLLQTRFYHTVTMDQSVAIQTCLASGRPWPRATLVPRRRHTGYCVFRGGVR